MLIRGGAVVTEKGAARLDVRIVGESVAAIGRLSPEQGETVLDATGLFVLPGMLDVHVHIDDRIGECDLADTFATASEVAVRTGITTLAGFVTQGSDETLSEAVARCVARGIGRSHCDFTFHLTPTAWPWDWGEVEALVARGLSTFKVYTTYREAGLFTDSGRVPEIAQRTGCQLHVVHVSTVEGATAIGEARRHCLVSCETAPHYLLLDETAPAGAGGPRSLCTP